LSFRDFDAGVSQNKAEAARLYQEAADGGAASAAERLKALQPYQSTLKFTNKGQYVQLTREYMNYGKFFAVYILFCDILCYIETKSAVETNCHLVAFMSHF